MRKKIYISLLSLFFSLALVAQKHTEFLHLSLEMPAEELVGKLEQKGLQLEDSCNLSGFIASLEIRLHVEENKDTTGCSYLMLTTQRLQGRSMREDYSTLMRWMQRHYGKPTWEGMVRSYPFARWFIDFDHDIVMITTASTGVEIWFYENHQVRNIDYYAILKYCERHPVDGIPYYAAWEQKTWKTTLPVVAERKVVKKDKKHKKHKKHSRRRATKSKKHKE